MVKIGDQVEASSSCVSEIRERVDRENLPQSNLTCLYGESFDWERLATVKGTPSAWSKAATLEAVLPRPPVTRIDIVVIPKAGNISQRLLVEVFR